MKNKRGSAVVIALVVLFGLMIFGGLMYVAFGEKEQAVRIVDGGDALTNNCDTDPYITASGRDALKPGTAATPDSFQYAKNGLYIGTLTSGSSGTKFSIGDKVDVHATKSGYIDVVKMGFEIKTCGQNDLIMDLYKATDTSNFAFTVWNSAGSQLTNDAAGGATNQSTFTGSESMEVKIKTAADESSGDMVIVLEAENTTEVDDLYLTDFPGVKCDGVSVPSFYSVSAAGAIAKACEISAIVDDSKNGYLNIDAETSQTVGAGDSSIYITGYTKQWFVDTDGSYTYGIEDKDGTDKSASEQDYDFCIT